MQISRNSWHYRYLLWMGRFPAMARTYCEYWTMLVTTPIFATIKWALIVAGSSVALGLFLAMLWALVGTPVLYYLDIQVMGYKVSEERIEFWFTCVLVLTATIAFIVLASYLPLWLQDTTALIKGCYKDWQDKKCSRIEFKD